jgi:hypothetical protein
VRPRLRELLELVGTLEGTGGDQARGVRGERQRGDMVRAALATEWRHQHRTSGLGFHKPVAPDLVEVRALLPPLAAGDGQDVRLGLLITGVAVIAMPARASNEAVECCHPVGVECIQSTTERVIVEMAGLHTWGKEPRERLIVEKMGHEVKLLVKKAQAVKDHGFDRMAYSHNPHFRVLLGSSINDLRDTQLFKQLRDQAQVI